jgi:hypothetical protein
MISNEKLLAKFSKFITTTSYSGWKYWRTNEVIEGYRFYYGIEQFDPKVKAEIIASGMRPLVMNRIPKFIRGAANQIGKAIGQIRYYPGNDPNAGTYAEGVNTLFKWAAKQSALEHQLSLVRIDAMICGLGVIELALDQQDNPLGEPRYYRVSPLEMLVDQDDNSLNFTESDEICRARIISREKYKARWPKAANASIDPDFTFAVTQASGEQSPGSYQGQLDPTFGNGSYDSRISGDNVTVYDYQWRELGEVIIMTNPFKDQEFIGLLSQNVELSESMFAFRDGNKLSDQAMIWMVDTRPFKELKNLFNNIYEFQSAKVEKYKYYRAFLTKDQVLEVGPGPFPDSFTYKFFTAYYDEDKRCPYGILRAIKDPQRVSNGAFLNMYRSVAAAPKYSQMAERGITDEHDAYEQRIANSAAVVWVKDGAVTGGRTKDNMRPPIPTGFETPFEISVNSMPDITGLNLDFLGQSRDKIAGILDEQRTDRGFDQILDIISNCRAFYNSIGSASLHLFRDLAEIAPGRIVSIIGEKGAETAQLLKDKLAADYLADVDEAPESVNQKQENTNMLTALLQRNVLPPDMQLITVMAIIENSSLPKSIKDRYTQAFEAMQQPNPAAEQEKAKQEAANEAIITATAKAAEGEYQRNIADAQYKEAQKERAYAEAERIRLESEQTEGNIIEKTAKREMGIFENQGRK